MSTSDPKVPVLNYLKAFAEKNFEAMRPLLATNLSFRGPLEQHSTRDSFIASLAPLGPMLKEYKIKKIFVDGSDVCVITEFVTTHPTIGTTDLAEWYTVRDEKIQAIRLFFDARPYV